jgi:hypothetical protein
MGRCILNQAHRCSPLCDILVYHSSASAMRLDVAGLIQPRLIQPRTVSASWCTPCIIRGGARYLLTDSARGDSPQRCFTPGRAGTTAGARATRSSGERQLAGESDTSMGVGEAESGEVSRPAAAARVLVSSWYFTLG